MQEGVELALSALPLISHWNISLRLKLVGASVLSAAVRANLFGEQTYLAHQRDVVYGCNKPEFICPFVRNRCCVAGSMHGCALGVQVTS